MFRHAIYFCVFVLSFTAAHAQGAAPSKLYIGYGYVSHTLDDEDNVIVASSLDLTGSEITFGYRISDTLSVEFQRGDLTLGSAEIPFRDSTITVDETDSETTKLSFLFSAPLAQQDDRRIFFRLGTVEEDADPIVAQFEGETISVNVENDSGRIIGSGVDFDVDRLTLRAEVLNIYENEDFGLSVSAMYNF